jgi:hypothetical protein
MSGIAVRDWRNLYEQSFKYALIVSALLGKKFAKMDLRHLKPGGYVESQEFDLNAKSDDNSLAADSPVIKYCIKLQEGSIRGGFSLRIDVPAMCDALKAVGFVDISVREFKLPIGAWPRDPRLREAGEASLMALLDGLYGLSVACFTRFLGWEVAELNVFLEEVRKEWKRKAVHSYWPL